MRPLIAGNWKMHGLAKSLAEIEKLASTLAATPAECDVLICPPASLLTRAAEAAGEHILIGGQDCHTEDGGPFTGDISAEMLKDAGASHVIVGHSERRQAHGETDAIVAAKAKAGWRGGLGVIICVGETEAERDAGKALDVVAGQIAGSVPQGALAALTAIAYEPVWAIGTGKTPTLEEIEAMHGHIRARLEAHMDSEGADMRILYGGSVKPGNAAEILKIAEVGGALVGGASLKATDFHSIIAAVTGKS